MTVAVCTGHRAWGTGAPVASTRSSPGSNRRWSRPSSDPFAGSVRYAFRAGLWLYAGEGGWHFVTLPVEVGEDIDARTSTTRRGFGSVRVEATIGGTTWRTSIFPDKKAASFVLPVKKGVRVAEGIRDGDSVEVAIRLLPP